MVADPNLHRPDATEFVTALATTMGLVDRVTMSGTTVLPSPDRAGSSMAVAYAFAVHTVLWCDPALVVALDPITDAHTKLSLTAFEEWAIGAGWSSHGRSLMHLPPPDGVFDQPRLASGSGSFRSLRPSEPADLALIRAFVATLPDDDRDEADLDDDEFDDHVLAIVDAEGIAAFASQKPFDHATRFADIAVATRPDRRGSGLGRAVVARLCGEIIEREMVPLYRRDPANTGSVALCAALEFMPVLEIAAAEKPTN